MYAFVWEYVRPVSDAYHDGGGVLITAANVETARALWREWVNGENSPVWPLDREEVRDTSALDGEPDHVLTLAPEADTGHYAEAKVLVFADTGCC